MSDRLADLEARVAALEAEVLRLRASPPLPPAPPRMSPPPMRPARAPQRPPVLDAARRLATAGSGEELLSRVGIGLLLVGVVFLLKWSIDQGWLGPAVRVAGTAALGLALVVGGWRLRPARAVLGDVLVGGGLAVLYGSVMAGGALYGFFGPAAALALAALVAAASYGLALRAHAPVLALVGVVGALGFPVVLYEDPTSLPLALAFAVLVAAGGAAVWRRTAWPALLAALAVAFWVSLGVLRFKAGRLDGTERTAFQAAVVAGWALVGLVPLARAEAMPDGWRGVPRLLRPRPLAVWASATGAFALTAVLWHLSGPATAVLALAGAVAYAATALLRADDTSEGAALAAFGLAASACGAGLDGGLVAGALVAVAVGTAALARPRGWTALARLADGAALAAAAWTAVFLVAEGGDVPTAEGVAAAVLAVGSAGMAAARRATGTPALAAFAAHTLGLAAAYYLLAWAPLGTALVNGAWGLYAVALVAAGLRTGRGDLRLLGLSTLAMTVAKILVVDIRGIPMAARVVIFMGLGGLVLAVSYLAPHWLRGRTAPPAEEPDA